MQVRMMTTTYERNVIHTRQMDSSFCEDTRGVENELINIYPQVRYQEFHGFGGALTESSGYVLSKMGDAVYDAILEDYFGKDGLGYTFARSHIDSCDFSLGNYSAVTDAEDTEFNSFSLQRAKQYVIPLILKATEKCGGKLNMMLSPWSPPAFMKTNNDQNHGGKLKDEYRGAYARYLCRHIAEYRKLGINVKLFSIQNEQKAVQTWDSCLFTAKEEQEFIRDYLMPELKRQGIGDIVILAWDHNKERVVERMIEVMKGPGMGDLIGGIAFHWYSGDHFEALDIVKKLYPDKRLVFSEGCVELSKYAGMGQLHGAQKYAHDIIGNLNQGMDTFIDWNIVLDEAGGPNHVKNYCDAPIICNIQNGTYERKLSYYYIGHFSRYIRPGAVRIGFSRYTDRLEVTAFKNKDGSIAVVVMNPHAEDIPMILRQDDQILNHVMPGQSITTFVY